MIKNYKNAETIYEADGIIGKKLNEKNGCEYVHISINIDKEIIAHTLPMPVTFYVLQGNAELTIDNNKTNIIKGDMVEAKAESLRAWKNIGTEKVILLAIKHIKK